MYLICGRIFCIEIRSYFSPSSLECDTYIKKLITTASFRLIVNINYGQFDLLREKNQENCVKARTLFIQALSDLGGFEVPHLKFVSKVVNLAHRDGWYFEDISEQAVPSNFKMVCCLLSPMLFVKPDIDCK